MFSQLVDIDVFIDHDASQLPLPTLLSVPFLRPTHLQSMDNTINRRIYSNTRCFPSWSASTCHGPRRVAATTTTYYLFHSSGLPIIKTVTSERHRNQTCRSAENHHKRGTSPLIPQAVRSLIADRPS
jgi:hypothetical protein